MLSGEDLLRNHEALLRRNPKNAIRIAVSAACAGAPVAAQAQGALEEIVVTATKREASLQEIPLAVTALSDEEITRQGFKNFADYVGQIPSLSLSERQPGATQVIMRGCASQGLTFQDSATTSVYLDEQPITAAGQNPDPRLIDVERVEALSGPQGTLFGDAAQCGTLRVITNKPDPTAFDAWVDATGSKVKHGDEGYDFSAMVNMPLIDDTLALRLVGFVAEEPGFVDNVLSPSPGTGRAGVPPANNFDNSDQVDDDINTGTYYGGRAGLRWETTEDWTLDLNGIYQKYELKDGFGDVDLNQQFYADTSTFPNLGELDQIRFNEEDWEDEWYQLAVTAEGDLGFADLVVTAAYFDRETTYNADATAYLQAFQQLGDSQTYYYLRYDFDGDPRANAFDERETEAWTIEARLSSAEDSGSRWGWIGGFFYNHRELDEIFTSNVDGLWTGAAYDTPAGFYLYYVGTYYYNASPTTPSNNFFTGTYDSELDQWAIFGEVSFDVTDNFTVTAGGRWYDIENDYTVVQGPLIGLNGRDPNCTVDYCFTGTTDNTGSSDDDGFVGKLNLAYTWDEQLIYATYSEGFRRGGANSAKPQSIFGPGNSNAEYDSDEVDNYEIGAKTEWFDNTFRFNISAYYMEWDDIQVQREDPDPALFALGIDNAPQAEILGVDMWANWSATDNLQFDATAGWNDSELSEDYEDINTGEILAEDGTTLPLMPDWKASLTATYSFSGQLLSADPYVLVGYQYTGESKNSLGIESSEFTFPVRTQDSYQTVNVRAGLETDTWTASVFVDNIFDEYGETFYSNRWAQQRLTVNQPLTVGVNYRYRFGDN